MKYKRLHNRKSLFNLAEDPREKHAIGDRGQGRPFAEALIADHEEKSARIRADFETADSDLRAPALPAETQESLRALGYIE